MLIGRRLEWNHPLSAGIALPVLQNDSVQAATRFHPAVVMDTGICLYTLPPPELHKQIRRQAFYCVLLSFFRHYRSHPIFTFSTEKGEINGMFWLVLTVAVLF